MSAPAEAPLRAPQTTADAVVVQPAPNATRELRRLGVLDELLRSLPADHIRWIDRLDSPAR